MKIAGVVLAIVGAVVLGIGLWLGNATVHAAGVSCGTAFGGQSDAAYVNDLTNAMEADSGGYAIAPGNLSATENACSSSLDSRDTVAKAASYGGGGLLAAGVLLAGIGFYQAAPRRPIRYGV